MNCTLSTNIYVGMSDVPYEGHHPFKGLHATPCLSYLLLGSPVTLIIILILDKEVLGNLGSAPCQNQIPFFFKVKQTPEIEH